MSCTKTDMKGKRRHGPNGRPGYGPTYLELVANHVKSHDDAARIMEGRAFRCTRRPVRLSTK